MTSTTTTGRLFRPIVLLTSALSLLAEPCLAETISRDRALSQALQQNPQVAAAQARRAQSGAEQTQADAARWPSVKLELGVGPSLRAELVPGTASQSTRSRYDVSTDDLSAVFGGRVSVIMPVYTFGKIDGFRQAAAHALRAREAQVTMTRGEVAVEVARLYEALLFARDATRFFEELEHYIDRTILATKERLEAGGDDVNEQDLLRLQTALSAVRLSLNYARTGQQQAQAGVVAYLGLPSGTLLEPQEDQLLALPGVAPAAPALRRTALERRPEMVALEQGARAFDSLSKAERAGDLPDVFLMGFADGAYTPGRDLATSRYVSDPLHHFDPGLLLGLRWQIQGAMARGRAEQRDAQARELRELRLWATRGLPAQVEKARTDAQRARRDVDEAHAAVGRSKQWMVQANSDYVVGLANSQSLVDAVRAYAELRAAELDATFRHNVALAELAYATGTIVTDELGLYPGKVAR